MAGFIESGSGGDLLWWLDAETVGRMGRLRHGIGANVTLAMTVRRRYGETCEHVPGPRPPTEDICGSGASGVARRGGLASGSVARRFVMAGFAPLGRICGEVRGAGVGGPRGPRTRRVGHRGGVVDPGAVVDTVVGLTPGGGGLRGGGDRWGGGHRRSLIHIPEPTRLRRTSYAVFCLKKKIKHI